MGSRNDEPERRAEQAAVHKKKDTQVARDERCAQRDTHTCMRTIYTAPHSVASGMVTLDQNAHCAD